MGDAANPAAQLRQHSQQQQQQHRQQHAQLAQHAQHAQNAQHQAAPIGRTASAAELRSLAVGGAIRLTSGAQVPRSCTLLDANWTRLLLQWCCIQSAEMQCSASGLHAGQQV